MGFEVVHQLEGWLLVWRRLELADGGEAAVEARRRWVARARERWSMEGLAAEPVVTAMRRLFRTAGVDPTRYRPSSEALLRRVLKGEELPAIQPLVDVNNCVSIGLAVPSCVMAEGAVRGGVRLRAGREGERMESLRGDFDLVGKPLLEDELGPFGTPITDSRRVKVEEETRHAWLLAYLPAGVVGVGEVDAVLEELAGVAVVREGFASGGGG